MKTYKTQQRYPSPKPDIAAATSPQVRDIAAAISHPYGISHARYRLYDIIQRSYDEHSAVIPRDIMLISTTSYTPPI